MAVLHPRELKGGEERRKFYNPGHFTSVLLFFGITFDPGMLKILKTRHLKAKISYFLIVKFWVPSWYPKFSHFKSIQVVQTFFFLDHGGGKGMSFSPTTRFCQYFHEYVS